MFEKKISYSACRPAVGSYAENQRITAVRKVYNKALGSPVLNIEQIWIDYCSWEKSVNPQLSEKLISDKIRDYQRARGIAKSQEQMMRGINRNWVSIPPRGSPSEFRQVEESILNLSPSKFRRKFFIYSIEGGHVEEIRSVGKNESDAKRRLRLFCQTRHLCLRTGAAETWLLSGRLVRGGTIYAGSRSDVVRERGAFFIFFIS